MIPRFWLFMAFALALLSTSCAHRPPSLQAKSSEQKPTGAHLSRSQAIEIAKRAVERFLRSNLNRYADAEPKATYRPSDPKMFGIGVFVEGPGEAPPGDHVWVVDFGSGSKSNYPGGDLVLEVDDKTGRAAFLPSM